MKFKIEKFEKYNWIYICWNSRTIDVSIVLKIKSIVIKSKLPTSSTVGSLFCGIFTFSVFNKFTARIILAARGTDFCTAVPLFQGTLSIHRSCQWPALRFGLPFAYKTAIYLTIVCPPSLDFGYKKSDSAEPLFWMVIEFLDGCRKMLTVVLWFFEQGKGEDW